MHALFVMAKADPDSPDKLPIDFLGLTAEKTPTSSQAWRACEDKRVEVRQKTLTERAVPLSLEDGLKQILCDLDMLFELRSDTSELQFARAMLGAAGDDEKVHFIVKSEQPLAVWYSWFPWHMMVPVKKVADPSTDFKTMSRSDFLTGARAGWSCQSHQKPDRQRALDAVW